MNESKDPRDCCYRCGGFGHSLSDCPVWRGFTKLIGGAK